MALLLVLVFVVVPILELAVIIQVGQAIGAWETLALLVGISIVGAWLVKREGIGAWRRVNDAVGQGRVPAGEILDGFLVLFAGALLLTPGFLTDALGLVLLIPPTRAVVRRVLAARFLRRTRVVTARVWSTGGGPRTVVDVDEHRPDPGSWDADGGLDPPGELGR